MAKGGTEAFEGRGRARHVFALVARIPQDGDDEPAAMFQNLVLHDVPCRLRDICNRLSSTSISLTRS
jgi:hypothetical protein